MFELLPMALFTFLAMGLGVLDLAVLRRGAVTLGFAEAAGRTVFFVSLAVAVGIFVGFASDSTLEVVGLLPETIASGGAATEFLSAYFIELSLSVNNVLVIALILGHFRLSPLQQHKALFWGVPTAFVLRAIMILTGAALLDRFEWATYVFGALLLMSASRLLMGLGDELDVTQSRLYRWASQTLRSTSLVLPLILVEGADVVFAFDSVPAVLAVTRDPMIAYTSNVLAVLGMRSLYFLIVPLVASLRYLRPSLALVLVFVAVKFLLEHTWPVRPDVSLMVTTGIVAAGVLASLLGRRSRTREPDPAHPLRQRPLTAVSLRGVRRAVVFTASTTVILIAVAAWALPGLSLLLALLGLALLATEVAWARLWMRRLKRTLKSFAQEAIYGPHDLGKTSADRSAVLSKSRPEDVNA